MAGGAFGGGTGTSADPYLIQDAADLDVMRNNLSAFYKLMADINLDVAPYNISPGWVPVGNQTTPFTGGFDGNNHTISKFYLNRVADYQGFFGWTGFRVEIKNVTFTNSNVSGGYGVGTVVGVADRSKLTNVKVTGFVNSDSSQIGGLIGIGTGYGDYVYIVNSSFTGNVSGNSTTSNAVGGLVGSVIMADINTGSFFNGSIWGAAEVGGLVGFAYKGNTSSAWFYITDSYAYGGTIHSVGPSSTSNIGVGGLLGRAYFTYDGSSTGLAVYIQNSYSKLDIDVTSAGINNQFSLYIGGLVGYHDSNYGGSTSLRKSYYTGTITSPVDGHIGGLLGFGSGTGYSIIDQCASYGVIIATDKFKGSVGGLTGWLNDGGGNNMDITDSYSKMEFRSGSNTFANVGGLIGYNGRTTTVKRSYAANKFNCNATSKKPIVGNYIQNPSSDNYFDTDLSGLTDATYATPKTTAQMKAQATYINYDFTSATPVWKITEGVTYAFFAWQLDDSGGMKPAPINLGADGFPTLPPPGTTVWVMGFRTYQSSRNIVCSTLPTGTAATFTRDQLIAFYPELHNNTGRDVYDYVQFGGSYLTTDWYFNSATGVWDQSAGTAINELYESIDRNSAFKDSIHGVTPAIVLPTINQDDPNTFPSPPADAGGNIWAVFSEGTDTSVLYVLRVLKQTDTTPFNFKRFIFDATRDSIHFTDPTAYYNIWRYKYEVNTGLYRSVYDNYPESPLLESNGGNIFDPKFFDELARKGKGYRTFKGIVPAQTTNDISPPPTKDYSTNPGSGLGNLGAGNTDGLYIYSAKLNKWLLVSVAQ